MKFYIGKNVEWDPTSESIVIYNIGNGTRTGSFRWSDTYLATYRERYGEDSPAYLDTSERVDNERAVSILQTIGFDKAAHKSCVLTAFIVDKELAKYGLVVERYPDGTEYPYIDEHMYVVNKLLQMSNTIANPSSLVHSILTRCRELMNVSRSNEKQKIAIPI